jgi:3-hydroxyisobutyrate dehydrogenase-like beta-hydroxyacid dehydrogenase
MLCALYAAAFALAATLASAAGITPPAKPETCNGGLMDNA